MVGLCLMEVSVLERVVQGRRTAQPWLTGAMLAGLKMTAAILPVLHAPAHGVRVALVSIEVCACGNTYLCVSWFACLLKLRE